MIQTSTLSTLSNSAFDHDSSAELTPFQVPEIEHIIQHINEEHYDELVNFLRVFKNIDDDTLAASSVRLSHIYEEGITISQSSNEAQNKHSQTSPDHYLNDNVTHSIANSTNSFLDSSTNNPTNTPKFHFIRFKSAINQLDELQMQYILLKQKADKKIGKKTIKLKPQRFVVEDSYMVSKNMLRLVLNVPDAIDANSTDTTIKNKNDTENEYKKSNANPSLPVSVPLKNSVPLNEAGYAYLFDLTAPLKTNAQMQNSQAPKPKNPREHCYYTLRKAWQENDTTKAWVDVFLHGNTSGGMWANSLERNDVIISKREFPEKIEHLQEGQALLIADETSLPTVARLLETWQNPIPPIVLSITKDGDDQSYLDNVKLSAHIGDHICVLPLVMGQNYDTLELTNLIDNYIADYLHYNPKKIEKVWGALEAKTVKALRPKLRQRFDLDKSEVVVKVYWRNDD